MPFIAPNGISGTNAPFRTIFIRAPVVEKILASVQGEQTEEAKRDDTVIAPAKVVESVSPMTVNQPVEVLASLPGRRHRLTELKVVTDPSEEGDIVAVRQGNVFGCSFHPELTTDARIHAWWMQQVKDALTQQSTKAVA